MKKYEKLVQEAFLDDEETVIKRLKQVYNQSLKDITKKAQELQNQINSLQETLIVTDDATEKERLKSMIQSKVYQQDYQKALKTQVSSILDELHVNEFKTVSEYLTQCYSQGFLSAMYSLQQQEIPLIMPMDQEAMVRAVQLDSKISNGLYSRLGEDVTVLKKKITAQVSRGISTGMSFDQVAKQLSDYTNIGFNNAVRIARTEGHRIQVQSGMDACYKAKEKGADVVKQWDSTLDGATRPSHKKVDGEIKELDEPFSNGLMCPGDSAGGASEVVNCRCALLQRARWALDEEELETLKERAAFFGLDKNDSFEDFKEKYLKAAESIKSNISPVSLGSAETKNFKELCDYMEKTYGVKVSSKVQSLDFETVKDSVSGIEWTMQQFPKTQGYLKRIDSNKKGGVMNCTGNVIACSPTAFDGHYYQGNHKFFISTGVHEATHMTEGYLIDTTASGAKEFADMWNSHSVAKGIVKEAVAKLPDDVTKGRKYWEIYKTISPYASTDASECLAEAVSDVYQNGEKASLLSREIFSILKGVTE